MGIEEDGTENCQRGKRGASLEGELPPVGGCRYLCHEKHGN